MWASSCNLASAAARPLHESLDVGQGGGRVVIALINVHARGHPQVQVSPNTPPSGAPPPNSTTVPVATSVTPQPLRILGKIIVMS
jgi:hypothetical protein